MIAWIKGNRVYTVPWTRVFAIVLFLGITAFVSYANLDLNLLNVSYITKFIGSYIINGIYAIGSIGTFILLWFSQNRNIKEIKDK